MHAIGAVLMHWVLVCHIVLLPAELYSDIRGHGANMGLDGVELVMAVEEEFKIAISDADATECVTVSKLVDLVHSRLRHNTQDPCASQHGFYVVRRHLMNVLGLRRAQVRPETRLDAVIGRANRRQRWRDLGASVVEQQMSWPALVRPKWVTTVLYVVAAAACLGVALFTWLPCVVALCAAISVGLVGAWLTVPLKREFAARYSEVRDLVQFISTLDAGVWSKEEVFQKVRAITVEQLGVKESQVTLEARFVDDLGVG